MVQNGGVTCDIGATAYFAFPGLKLDFETNLPVWAVEWPFLSSEATFLCGSGHMTLLKGESNVLSATFPCASCQPWPPLSSVNGIKNISTCYPVKKSSSSLYPGQRLPASRIHFSVDPSEHTHRILRALWK